ncbi:hypothetical protein R3P38DRAFT_2684573 [Favolaschia claudopus]|uniref:F-box domain-containing protein n=1 Tax=Favolaschia claudopus TaxID=2862362 RepID=A0AAW0DLQ9_9AGAR
MELFKLDTPGIHERLRNNDVPSDTEKQSIRDSIETARTRLDALQNQGLLLDPEAQALSSYIAEYSSLLAPIRRLPVDLLRTIFLDPDIHEKKRDISRKSILTEYKPNRLGAVSHHWRCVTLETATMWSAIAVFLHRPSRYSVDALRIALQRSQNALLTLSFRPVSGSKTWSAIDTEMMHEVLQHAERWAVVDLSLQTVLLPHLSPAEGRLTNLHTLTLHDDPTFRFVETPALAIIPKLRTLSIMHLSHLKMLPALPLSQLTRLSLNSNNDNPDLYYHLFSQAQNIHHLSVRLFNLHPVIPPRPPVVSPHLQKMTLYGPGSDGAHEMDVLARVTAPALRHFQAINLNYWDTPIMQAFVERSAFSLRTLVLYLVPTRVGELLDILRLLPTVETLFLEDLIPNAITNAAMEVLTPPTEILLPALSKFVLSGAYLFGEDRLLTMLESRITAANQTAALDVVAISLPHLILSAASLQRLNTIRVLTTSFRLSYINQGHRITMVEHGPHMGWIDELRLEVKEVETSTQQIALMSAV